MAFYISALVSACDYHIGPEGRYESKADTRADMENSMLFID